MKSFSIASIFLSVCLIVESYKWPSSWTRCHKSDPEIGECLRKSIEDVGRHFDESVPDLGLSPFDPLNIPELYIGEGKGTVAVEQHFKNVKIYGLNTVKVLKAQMDFDKLKLDATSLSPSLRLEGDYNLNGKVLLLPIVGQGRFNITLVNLKVEHGIQFKRIEKKGETYLDIVEFTVKTDPEKVIFNFDNLFDGQKDLGDNINKVLNDNYADIYNDVRDGYEKSFSMIFADLSKRIFSRIPEKDIFLE